MDIDALVMAAGARHKAYATGADTYPTPIGGALVSGVTFPDVEQAQTFEAACMGDGVAAKYYGLVDGTPTVVVLH